MNMGFFMLTSTITRYRSHLLFAALATCLSCGDGDKQPAAAPAGTGAGGGTQPGQPATPAVGPSSLPVLPSTASGATPPVTKPTTPPPTLVGSGSGGPSGDKPPVTTIPPSGKTEPAGSLPFGDTDLASQAIAMRTRAATKKAAAKAACPLVVIDQKANKSESEKIAANKLCRAVHTFCEISVPDYKACVWTEK